MLFIVWFFLPITLARSETAIHNFVFNELLPNLGNQLGGEVSVGVHGKESEVSEYSSMFMFLKPLLHQSVHFASISKGLNTSKYA